MHVRLYFPPVSDPTFPPHGVARLAGFLRARGVDVATRDANIAFVHHMLSVPRLRAIETDLQSALGELEAREALGEADWARYRAIGQALLASPAVIDNIEAAKAVMRDRTWFDDANTYNWAHQVMVSAWRMVSARYHPTSFGFHNWSSGAPLELAEIQRCVSPDTEQPFRTFYDGFLRDDLPDGPAVLGISVMFLDQLVPALELARALRTRCPEAHVTLGGAYITHLADKAQRLLEAFPFLESLVPGAGEAPLLQMAQGQTPPGIFTRGGVPPTQQQVHRYDVTDTTVPAYEPTALPLYLSPEPVLPIRASRGCYWGRCVYCSHHLGEGRYAPRSVQTAFDEMMELHQRHGARFFYLSDDALSPSFVRRFSDLILESGTDVRWFGDARPEDLDADTIAKAARAGLVMLFLGVESASDRVRERMQRGRMDKVRDCIDACHRHGVILKLNFIFGFPGETEDEVQQTLSFIEEVRAPADILGSCPFYMTAGSPLQIAHSPSVTASSIGHQTRKHQLDQLAVQLRDPDPDDLTLMWDFTTPSGQTAQGVIDRWLERYEQDPRLKTSMWRVFDLSRTHRALLHSLHQPSDFEPLGPAKPVRESSPAPPAASAAAATAAAPVSADPMIRTARPVHARVFRYNLAARGGAVRIAPMSFVCDELVRFPNPDGGVTMAGVPPAVGALIEGELRDGLRWSAVVQRLQAVEDGAYAVQVLVQLGMLVAE